MYKLRVTGQDRELIEKKHAKLTKGGKSISDSNYYCYYYLDCDYKIITAGYSSDTFIKSEFKELTLKEFLELSEPEPENKPVVINMERLNRIATSIRCENCKISNYCEKYNSKDRCTEIIYKYITDKSE
jgi:hypothetical protein